MKTKDQVRHDAELAISQGDPKEIGAAYDEISRELMVRERCYPRWIKEQKISRTDAEDRTLRQENAKKWLQVLLDMIDPIAVE